MLYCLSNCNIRLKCNFFYMDYCEVEVFEINFDVKWMNFY